MPWLLALFLLLIPLGVHAERTFEEGAWTFAPVIGVGQPRLGAVYDGMFLSPFSGVAQLTTDLPEDVEGEVTYPTQQFTFYNPLDRPIIGPEAGIEFRRQYGDKSDFIIGVGTWEVTSSADTLVLFPLQGEPDNQAEYTRRASISYTQYYLGFRRYARQRRNKRNIYIAVSAHEVFDVDYKEEHVFNFISGAPKGFKRIMVIQAQSTGILLLQAAFGMERRFSDRFSVSVEGAYIFGVKESTLRGVDVRHDFNVGDRLTRAPAPIDVNIQTSEVVYLPEDGDLNNRQRAVLDFNGWKVLAKFSIDF